MIESKSIRDWIDKHIVSTWRFLWRKWSLRLNTIGLTILSYAYIDPVTTLYIWSMMPQDVRDVLPQDMLMHLGFALVALSILSQFVRQPKLEAKIEAKTKAKERTDA